MEISKIALIDYILLYGVDLDSELLIEEKPLDLNLLVSNSFGDWVVFLSKNSKYEYSALRDAFYSYTAPGFKHQVKVGTKKVINDFVYTLLTT